MTSSLHHISALIVTAAMGGRYLPCLGLRKRHVDVGGIASLRCYCRCTTADKHDETVVIVLLERNAIAFPSSYRRLSSISRASVLLITLHF